MAGMASKPRTLAALFLSASLLAACGGGGGSSATNDAQATHTQAAQEQPATDMVSTGLNQDILFETGEEPAAGVVFLKRSEGEQVHQEMLSVTTKASATAPVISRAPAFAAAGKIVRVGTPVTRVSGQYRNGFPTAAFRTRNGVDIPDGRRATYTPSEADLGKRLVYRERVLNPQTGETIVAQSAPVTVISRTAPAARTLPAFGPNNRVIRVGEAVTRIAGSYELGEPIRSFRLRNGVEIEGASGASYTPTEADVGKILVYGERIRNAQTGEEITVYSAEVTVVKADGSATSVNTQIQPVSSAEAAASPAPTMSVAPRFAPAGKVVMVGEPVTRVTGVYENGVAFEGFRLRNGVEIPNGYSASYTPVAADVGQKIIYGERVRNPKTGEVKTFYSAEITVVDNAAPAVVTAPALSVQDRTTVNQRLTFKTGSYRNGEVYARQWQRDGADISGATGSSYTTSSADLGKKISLVERVRNTSNGNTANFYSNVVEVQGAAPTATSQPSISVGTGNATVGQRVLRTMGTYANGTVAHARWYVDGAELGWGPHYTPTAADVGKTLVYTEEVHSPTGEVVSFSAPAVKIVAAAAPAATASSAQAAPSQNTGSQGTVNSVQEIIDDMRLYNEGALAGVDMGMGWANGPGFVVMGNNPRGSNTPSYWQPANTYFKSNAYWNAINPWLVVFDGVGNQATNTRVQIRPIKIYMKRRSNNRWEQVMSVPVSGEDYPKHLQGSNTSVPNIRNNADGSRSLKPQGRDRVFHGWGDVRNFDSWDVKAIVVTLQARLVVDDTSKPDDRHLAKYLIHVGADYYPETSTRVNETAPAYYFPGVGVSRSKYVRNEWRSFNFATIDAGRPEPGGSISTQEFRDNPPPLE